MIKNIKIWIKRKLRTYRNRILKRINKVIEFFKLKTKGITIESTSYVTRPIYFISIFVLILIIINQKINKSDDKLFDFLLYPTNCLGFFSFKLN